MHSLGETAMLRGNFTMLGFIDSWRALDLERRLGFSPGRLAAGYAVFALAPGQRLGPYDFELQGSTRWSGGFSIRTRSSETADLEDLLSGRGLDVTQLKEKVCEFFARRGAQTPAKVVPVTTHAPGMQYPDANALGAGIRSGVPQFNLLVPRPFSVVKVQAAEA